MFFILLKHLAFKAKCFGFMGVVGLNEVHFL